ncbi:hypothetical protein OPT61_g2827 [Boeremia exigua]|uniref:Uncharacterized protein n=1 Tax=Boeremia exigua TaxID=749465 RepID=A0ACC2IKC2_9PLEO|nr:hypothetical protein OPT61_g2827 [Boeremia exigua]
MLAHRHPAHIQKKVTKITNALSAVWRSTDIAGLGLKEYRKQYEEMFNSFVDLTVKTLSVHGHKDFTAWEWEITGKLLIEPGADEKLTKEDAPLKKVVGCILMWWENDKITRNHDYLQMKTP